MGLFDWLRKPKSTEDLLAEARRLAAEAQFEKAIDAYARIRRGQRTPPILIEMARVYLSAGRKEDALDCARQALDVNPRFADALCVRGEVLLRENRRGDALKRFEEALQLDPGCAWAKEILERIQPLPPRQKESPRTTTRPEDPPRIAADKQPPPQAGGAHILVPEAAPPNPHRPAQEQGSRPALSAPSPGEVSREDILRLNQQVVQLCEQGRYDKAFELASRSLELARRHLSENDPVLAQSLHNLASLYEEGIGDYARAEPLYRQALAINQRTVGEEHPFFAFTLGKLAMLYRAMGNYVAAEPLYRQASGILGTGMGQAYLCVVRGQPRADLGASLNTVTAALRDVDTRLTARANFVPSLKHLESLYPLLDHDAVANPRFHQALVDFATSMNNLALLYHAMGDYAVAEPLFDQALAINETALGAGHPSVAANLSNLGLLYQAMGDCARAEPLFRKGLELASTLGREHPAFATHLNNLGLLYAAMGNYPSAEPLFRQASATLRTSLGETHPLFAYSLYNRATLYEFMGAAAEAEPLHREALAIRRRTLGEAHPDYAQSLNGLGGLFQSRGDYKQTEPLLHQALEIQRIALGEEHPDFARSLSNLAALYTATDRAVQALSLIRQAANTEDHLIGQVFAIGSERQRTAYVEQTQRNLAVFLSLVWGHLSRVPEAVQAALDLVLHRKAIEAEVQAVQRDAVLGGQYPHLRPQLQRWSTLRRQIAQKTLAGPGREGLQAHQQQLAQWHQQRERLEAELARQVPEMNLEQRLRAADRRAVALALPEGVSLVEFVRFSVFDFKAVPARGERRWQPARYLAFVLGAGNPDNIRLVDLGEAEPVDQLIELFRADVSELPEARNMARRPPAASPLSLEQAGQQLRATVFEPLLAALDGRRRVLISPDGNLTRLPFAVLPGSKGGLLMDTHHISYVNCGRDVLRFGVSSGTAAAALVAADPDFDLGTDAGSSPSANTHRGRLSRDLERTTLHFARLPGTRAEGITIAGLLGVQPWQDRAALEARLKRECRSPRILHLATHGFFLQDQKHDPNQERRDLGLSFGEGRLSGPMPENPLLRSGLALAGANTFLRGGPLPGEAEDGLLTAEDVSGLDLLATELVVLSACETGLGEVRTGEGVFGLQRAFTLAGAKTLVMSLWSVPDDATRELMENFYKRILKGDGRADALRNAQLALRQKYPDPYFWGAFICQGDPAPLASRPPARVDAMRV